MDKTVSDPNFAGMAVFTPVINGEVWPQLPGQRGGQKRVWRLCLSQDCSRQENPAQLVQDLNEGASPRSESR